MWKKMWFGSNLWLILMVAHKISDSRFKLIKYHRMRTLHIGEITYNNNITATKDEQNQRKG